VVGYEAFKVPYSIAGACVESDRLDLACGCDLVPEKRTAFSERWGCQAVYQDYSQMIERERPDMVAICTKAENHAELAANVANAGVPMIYLEKAMACSMTEADAVKEACQANGTVLNTGVLRRFGDHYQAVRRLIEEGKIGEPRAVVQMSGGTLLHSHIHAVDLALFLLGDPQAARVRGELQPRDLKVTNNRLDHDPPAVYQIELEDGTDAWNVPHGNHDVDIIGTEGMVSIMNNGMDFAWRQPEDPPRKWPRLRQEPLDIRIGKSATVACLEDLVEAYQSGRPSLNNVDVAHHATEICLAVVESHAQDGRWVELPLANRELYVYHV
jgi:predicted dehydrogenase